MQNTDFSDFFSFELAKALQLSLGEKKELFLGGKLSENDLIQVKEQVNFAVEIFGKNLNKEKKVLLESRLLKKFSEKSLSVKIAMKGKYDSEKERKREEKELFDYMKKSGQIYMGLIDEDTGKIYLRKNFSLDKRSITTPLHETIHVLQKFKVIKVDVPFAQTADRLYALEKGFIKPDKKIREPKEKEFDRLPKKEKNSKELKEPEWSYELGKKISQWVYLNLPEEKRWDYIYFRCKGKTHNQALNEISLN
ncbi:hypothetical protein KKG83_00025 [Candidatus Micrarchaeota archaeon]|nr:hypothetical protein [Candidatus Micrarchaeota archaeon]MBU2475838.1 hypothetical protein [Candidatus Micrarchaeota archaeon]